MLVKVDNLYFLADFIVLDMDEDRDVPLILERPFLAADKTLIDIQQGKLTLRVHDDEVTLNIFKAIKYSTNTDTCFQVDIIDKLMVETI